MNEARIRGLMGLSVRAGQAAFGEDGCLMRVRSGRCGALLVDGGASKRTREKYEGACLHANVPMLLLPEGLLEQATGRPGMAMAIAPGGLAEQLLRLADEDGLTTQPMKSANKCGGASV